MVPAKARKGSNRVQTPEMARMRPIVYPKWICKATVPMNIIYIYHYISVFIHLVICACMHASICTYKLLRFFKYILCVYNIYIYKFMGHGQYFAYSSKSSIFEECTIYRFSGLGNIANVIVF